MTDVEAAPPPALSVRSDLRGRVDVHDLVVAFYREVVFDDLLAPIFGEVAEVDWEIHIPKLIDYWCRVLFGEATYTGAILGPHERVHVLEPLHRELFDRWYLLWTQSIDLHWSGPTAERARTHAARISGMLSRKLTGEQWVPPRTDPESSSAATRSDLGGEAACWSHMIEDLDRRGQS